MGFVWSEINVRSELQLDNPGKQCIWIYRRAKRLCPEFRQAGHLYIQIRKTRFPENRETGFSVLVGVPPNPECAVGTAARFLQNRFRGKSEELRNHLPAVVLLLRLPDQREAGDETNRQGKPAEGFFQNAGDDPGDKAACADGDQRQAHQFCVGGDVLLLHIPRVPGVHQINSLLFPEQPPEHKKENCDAQENDQTDQHGRTPLRSVVNHPPKELLIGHPSISKRQADVNDFFVSALDANTVHFKK